MMKRLKIRQSNFCYLLVLFGLFACSEVIDLDTNQEGGQLIVFGRLSNSNVGNYVTVQRTGVLGKPPTPVFGAEVSISNGAGDTELLIEADSGVYELPGNVLIREPGRSYVLDVKVRDKTYSTAPQIMPENYGQDFLSWELAVNRDISSAGVAVEEDVVNIYGRTDFGDLPNEFYLRWDIEEAYTYLGTFLPLNHFPLSGGQVQCYVVGDLNEQRIFLHNGEQNRASSLPNQLFVSRRVDKSFQTLHYFNVIRSSLSKEAYEYWSRLDVIVNRQGSIFDVPPAPVVGNVMAETEDEEVLGFFEVVSVDTTRLALTRRDIPVFIFDDCERRGERFLELFTVPRDCRQCLIDEGIVDASCLQCNVLPGSSLMRPSYF